MFNVKKLLEDNGHVVIPFSIHSDKNVETPYNRYFVEPIGGRDVTYYDEYKKTPKTIIQMLSRSIYSFEVEQAIQREIHDERPDIVYVLHFINKLSPSVIRGAKKMGLPVVVRLSDYFLLCPRFDFIYSRKLCNDCLTKGLISCVRKKCVKGSMAASLIRVLSMKIHQLMHIYNDVDLFLTPSIFLKNTLVSNGFPVEKVRHLPSFIDAEVDSENDNVGTYGLYVGRITEEKGVETIIKAYKGLPNMHVKIVGDDSTKEGERLKSYIREKNIRNVSFEGFQRGERLKELYRKARFLIVPSIWYENMPNTVLEAYRFGKPVLASNLGSLPEIVKDGENGLLFAAGSVKELQECIRKMDDETTVRRIGVTNQKDISINYGYEAHYNQLMEVFKGLCKVN